MQLGVMIFLGGAEHDFYNFSVVKGVESSVGSEWFAGVPISSTCSKARGSGTSRGAAREVGYKNQHFKSPFRELRGAVINNVKRM